jgi:hypothetical protein
MIDCSSVYYGEHEEKIYVVREGFYSQGKGLSFKEEGIYM